jgi:hypothetical protein
LMTMIIITLIRSRDQVCAATRVHAKFVHFVLS